MIMSGSFLPSLGRRTTTGLKITALVLGWVEDSALRPDSRGFGVAGSFWQCALFRSFDRGTAFLGNGLPCVGSTRSADTVDGQWPRWLVCARDAVPAAIHNLEDASFAPGC